MAKDANRSQIYVRNEDRQRLQHLADRETRGVADQFTVIVREAFDRRGIDPDKFEQAAAQAGADTPEPVAPQPEAAAPA